MPERRTTSPRVKPWAPRVKTTTDVVSTRTSGRRPSSPVPSSATVVESAAASGTTPRVPAQVSTAGTRQDGRAPAPRWTTTESGSAPQPAHGDQRHGDGQRAEGPGTVGGRQRDDL